jgi:amino-acid N-acetyltransferase
LSEVERARIQDVPQIHQLVNFFADRDEMLPRSLSEIYENIRDYFVYRDGERVVACAALHVLWSDLAEIKAVAVAPEFQNKGIGTMLIETCLNEAKSLGTPTVFCLTYEPAFFEKFGLTQIDKMDLQMSRKVWAECLRCPKFPDCGEVALIRHL